MRLFTRRTETEREPDAAPVDQGPDAELLEEIRDRYRYYDDAWKEIREHSQKCRKYLDGDPWDPEDRQFRKETGRPCINHDELNQYVNQAVNNVRQNRRGIKVNPEGNGADEKTAEFRQNFIRSIEYRSHAQNVYATAYEHMVEGSYGFLRVTRRYVPGRGGKLQEILLKAIPNQDSVLYDPDCKEPDWCDAQGVFILDPMPRKEFQRRFKNAQIKDFTAEHLRIAKDWLQGEMVLVAEYWRAVTDPDDETGQRRKIVQYLTNGVEILERRPQPPDYIPIIPFIGKQRYVSDGGAPKRKLYALVSLALDPQMSLAFLASQEIEEAGMTPKTPVRGWKGQFASDPDAHQTAHKIPRGYLEYDYPEWALDRGIPLPLPQNHQFVPNFQQYEIAKDACRRAIQAAIGVSPLPTAAQRDNEKSGVALERIRQAEDIGSFHFVANFDRALEFAGRVIESWIPVVYDTEREIALRKADDSHEIVRINTAEPYPDQKSGKMVHYPVADQDADHGIEISIAPWHQSQREEASEFLDTLISNLPNLPVPPPQQAKLLSLAIQMRQLGPKGDEMAEIISPTEASAQGLAQLQAAQGQLQQQGVLLQQLQAEIQQLRLERAGKVIDNQFKMALEKMREENALAIAEVETKAQQMSERLQTFSDMMAQFHDQAHDVGMQAADQAHERAMAQQQADAAQQQQAAEAAQQQQAQVQQ